MLHSYYNTALRNAASAILLTLMLTIMQTTQAAEPKPLTFRELARGDTLMLTDQGKAFLSEKIHAKAFTEKVMNISWETDRKQLEKPTIYETRHDGARFLFVRAKYYHRIVMEVPYDKKEKRFNEIQFPGVDWVEFLHQDKHHRIDTSNFIAPRNYLLGYKASGMMFRAGINDHLIIDKRVESGNAQGSVPVNITLKAGAGNILRVQSRQLMEGGELTLVLYDYNDGEREIFNVKVDGDNHEAKKEFEVPSDRPIPEQTSIFELEPWITLP